jgi:molybdate transport system ATP-binding protein
MGPVLSLDLAARLRSFVLELALEVGAETVALVGPSGAGKTTVLRAIAGLVRPDAGRIALGGVPWFDAGRGLHRPAEERAVGYVFQDYALFPHLSVERNVGFGGRARVRELLERFRIAHLARARPGELSGGERQRVGLARALARDPAVLLLDEPLSALDAHTRGSVRLELAELLRELRLPTLLVTHDFEDAAVLADRVGVLLEGRLLQLGPPADLVAAPADAFVASLTGGNLLRGRAVGLSDGLTEVALENGGTVYSAEPGAGVVGVVVQPWDVAIAREQPNDSALNHVRAPITSLVPLGNRVRVRVGPLTAEVTSASADRLALMVGDVVVASFKATGTRLVPLAGNENV